jgi:hypothetical protein
MAAHHWLKMHWWSFICYQQLNEIVSLHIWSFCNYILNATVYKQKMETVSQWSYVSADQLKQSGSFCPCLLLKPFLWCSVIYLIFIVLLISFSSVTLTKKHRLCLIMYSAGFATLFGVFKYVVCLTECSWIAIFVQQFVVLWLDHPFWQNKNWISCFDL